MPHLPPSCRLPRLDIPGEGGAWRLRHKLKSPEARRLEFMRLMLQDGIEEPRRLRRMRTLLDLGLWGDHVSEQDLIDSMERREKSALAAIGQDLLSLVENTDYRGRDERAFHEARRQMGFHILMALNSGRCSAEMVHLALEAGTDPNWREQNNYDDTLLTLFARHLKARQFEVVLHAGGDPQKQDSCHETALHILLARINQGGEVGECAKAMAQMLVEAGVDLDDPGVPRTSGRWARGRIPLFDALDNGWIGAAWWLIQHGARLDVTDAQGNTVAHMIGMAWPDPSEKLLDLLATRGCDLDTPNALGQTPLWKALKEGRLQAAQYLIDHGARLDAQATGRLDDERNIVPEMGMTTLEALTRNPLDEPAMAIAAQILARHPDCWSWPAAEGEEGETLADMLRREQSPWWSVAENDLLMAHTAPAAPQNIKRKAPRL